MERLLPNALSAGAHIRVVAVSTSLSVVTEETRRIAQEGLEQRGFRVSFGDHVMGKDGLRSARLEDRLADFNAALDDPDVDMILAARGGFNVNQLLPHLDFEKIRHAGKIICGHSDLTALVNAVWARSGLVAYLGPNFSTLGMKLGAEYTWKSFTYSLSQPETMTVEPSTQWSDDKWQEDQDNRVFENNEGPFMVRPGEAQGTIVGGNLCTFNLLQGTPFMPSLDGALLFLEDDALTGAFTAHEFDRNFESLLQQPGAEGIRGLVLGRFQKASKVTKELLEDVIKTKPILNNVPVIANVDFGHTSPQLTLPIGGTAHVRVARNNASIELRQR